MRKLSIIFLMILLSVSFAYAGPFVPPGDMIGMGRYQIINFTNLTLVNSTVCLNGGCITGWSSIFNSSTYYTKTDIDAQQLAQNNTINAVNNSLSSEVTARIGNDSTKLNITNPIVSGNITADNGFMNINWSYLLNIPSYVKDWTSTITGLLSNTTVPNANYSQYINISNAQILNDTLLANQKALPGNCSAGQTVQNTTTSGVQCITPGTVTNIGRGFGFNNTGTNITSSGSLDINSTIIQRRMDASCSYGIGYVDEDGTVHCSVQQGTVTNITCNDGYLTGGSITNNGTCAVNETKLNNTIVKGSSIYNDTILANQKALPGTATCTGSTVAQNVTTTTTGTTSQCITPPQGTVTSITCGTGLDGGVITTSGTCNINGTQEATRISNSTIARTGTTTTCAYGLANVTDGVSGPSGVCAVQQGTVTSIIFSGGYLTGGTITGSGTVTVNETKLNATILTTASIYNDTVLANTKAAPANCPAGQFVMNTTTSGVQCGPVSGAGTVTSITFNGSGLLGGTITAAGTVALNDSYINANWNDTIAINTQSSRIDTMNRTKSLVGSSASCTYGISNFTLYNTSAPGTTCAAQQGTIIDVLGNNIYIYTSGTTNKTVNMNETKLNSSILAYPKNYTSIVGGPVACTVGNYKTFDNYSAGTATCTAAVYSVTCGTGLTGGTITGSGTCAANITDSTSSTSTTSSASPNSVKTAYDIGKTANDTANAAMPKVGGTFTGNVSMPFLNVTGNASIGDISTGQLSMGGGGISWNTTDICLISAANSTNSRQITCVTKPGG